MTRIWYLTYPYIDQPNPIADLESLDVPTYDFKQKITV